MARNASRERELRDEPLHALLIGRDVRIHPSVSSFEIGVRDQAWPAMSWAGDINHVQVVLLDEPVQMNIDEVQSWCGSPMAEKPRLDMVLCQRLLEQRVVEEIDLSDRQVVGGPPIRIHQSSFLVRQRI